jgi:uncharacterized membrane protein YfcA
VREHSSGGMTELDPGLISWGLLATTLLVIGIGSLAKGITGVGLPILAVPVLASFTSVEEAVVLMVLPSVAANGWLIVTHRRWSVLRDHVGFLFAGLIGGALGTWLLANLGDRNLKLILAIWLGVYLLQYFFARPFERYFGGHGGLGPVLGLAAGTIQGASGISAPIVAPYFHANGLVRERYAFATASAFLLFSISQIAAMGGMHLWTTERLIIGMTVMIPTLLFTHLGIRLSHRMSDKTFHRILLTLFIAMELKLLLDIVK